MQVNRHQVNGVDGVPVDIAVMDQRAGGGNEIPALQGDPDAFAQPEFGRVVKNAPLIARQALDPGPVVPVPGCGAMQRGAQNRIDFFEPVLIEEFRPAIGIIL